MPLVAKALVLLLVTIAAMLLSPATLAIAVWVAGPGAPLAGLLVIAGAAYAAFRTAAAIRTR